MLTSWVVSSVVGRGVCDLLYLCAKYESKIKCRSMIDRGRANDVGEYETHVRLVQSFAPVPNRPAPAAL